MSDGRSFVGVIIEESLEDRSVLKKVKILSTKVEKVTARHETPWLSQWTLHTVKIPEGKEKEIAGEISKSLDRKHGASWYADFKNDRTHFIIFRDRIFEVDRASKEQHDEVVRYGISLGIPKHQLDFKPLVKGKKR